MNILHVVHGYSPAIGGSELLVQGISERLVADHGDRVTVMTPNGYNAEAFIDPSQPLLPPGEFDLNGVHVKRLAVFNKLGPFLFELQRLFYRLRLPGHERIRTWYSGPIVPGLRHMVEEFECDLVAAASFPLLHMYTTLTACRRSNKPIVFVGALHPLDEWGYQRTMIYKAIQRADAYIALSSFERDYLVESWEVPEDKIAVTGIGIDTEAFEKADGTVIRERYSIEDRPLIAFIGQQASRKGVGSLIPAMKRVWQERPEARLLIAGARTRFAPDFEEQMHVQLAPHEKERVIYLQNFNDNEKADLFAACDVFAYPSWNESFGIAFLEAWAAGKPVVGCRSGAIPTVVSDGEDGLLVPPRDPDSLGIALLRLLNSKDLRRRLGRNGRNKVKQVYTWENVTRRWRDLYEKVLDG